MSPFPSSRTLLLASSVSSLIAASIAQQNARQQNSTQTNSTTNCDSNHFGPQGNIYNASGSYQIPGFYPPGTGPASSSNWTYNTAVIVDDTGAGEHTFWIDTPDGTDPSSSDLPYYGCNVALLGLPYDTVLRGQDDRGDCLRTLDVDCVSDTLENARQRALTFDETREEAKDVCSFTWASSCDRYIERGSSGIFGGVGNSSYSNDTDCPNHARGADRMLFGWGSSGGYDHAVTMVTPIVTVVFPKQNSKIDPGWTDARLVCMRPSEIAAGSRVPDGVPAEGSGVRTITSSVALSVAVTLGSGLMAML
ncbi:MAG: hypothetical protein Q9204_003236 [Flavoplaca sp. TL-2023a]